MGDDSKHDPLDDSERGHSDEDIDDLVDDSHDDKGEREVWFQGWAQLKRAVAPHLTDLKAAPLDYDVKDVGDGSDEGEDEPYEWYPGWGQLKRAAAPLVAHIKTVLARRPLVWFFAIAILPPLALVLLVSQVLIASSSECFLLVAMLLVVWALDNTEKATARTAERVAFFAAALAVCAVAFPLSIWAADKIYYVPVPSGTDSQFLDLFQPSLAHDIRQYLTAWQDWPNLILVAFAVSSILSPTGGMRRLMRELFEWSAPRRAYLFAVAAWPVLALVFVLGTYAFRGSPEASPWHAVLNGYSLFTLPALLITSALSVVAWFGFAARRLLTRYGPLAIVLVIAAAQNVRLIAVSLRFSDPLLGHVIFYMSLAAAVAILAVMLWLVRGSAGRLGPAIVFLVVEGFTAARLVSFIEGWYENGEGLLQALWALVCLAAIAVAWRGNRLLPPQLPLQEQPEARPEGEPDSAPAG